MSPWGVAGKPDRQPVSSTLPFNLPFDSSVESWTALHESRPNSRLSPHQKQSSTMHAPCPSAVPIPAETPVCHNSSACCSRRLWRLVNLPQSTASMCFTLTSVWSACSGYAAKTRKACCAHCMCRTALVQVLGQSYNYCVTKDKVVLCLWLLYVPFSPWHQPLNLPYVRHDLEQMNAAIQWDSSLCHCFPLCHSLPAFFHSPLPNLIDPIYSSFIIPSLHPCPCLPQRNTLSDGAATRIIPVDYTRKCIPLFFALLPSL